MAYLNIPIPVVDAYVRGNFLRDQQDSFDKKFECYIFDCFFPSNLQFA